MRAGRSPYLYRCSPALSSHWGFSRLFGRLKTNPPGFNGASTWQELSQHYSSSILRYVSKAHSTCCEADGNTLKCCLSLDPLKSVHWGKECSEVPTPFETGIKVLPLLLFLSGLQSFLGGFVKLVRVVCIYDAHVVNTVHQLRPRSLIRRFPISFNLKNLVTAR